MRYKGFTLLELLVVISIISLLATFGFVQLSNARRDARDTKRIADLKQVTRALELYYNDNGKYPIQTSWSLESGNSPSVWIPDIVASGHIDILPIDPINDPGANNEPWQSDKKYSYQYTSHDNNQEYNLTAKLENPNNENTCANKCWVFNTDSGSREGDVWCNSVNCSPPWQNYNPNLYSTYKAF